jgi:hypothetical protein
MDGATWETQRRAEQKVWPGSWDTGFKQQRRLRACHAFLSVASLLLEAVTEILECLKERYVEFLGHPGNS